MTVGDIEVVGCKIADAKSDANNLVDGLRRGAFDLCADIRQNVNQTLLAIGSRLRDLTDREDEEVQWSVHTALCNAADGAQESFVDVSKVMGRSPNLIIVHAKYDEPARPRSSTTHSASLESRRS